MTIRAKIILIIVLYFFGVATGYLLEKKPFSHFLSNQKEPTTAELEKKYAAYRPHDVILALTQPVTSFTGVIKKIDGSTIIVSEEFMDPLYEVKSDVKPSETEEISPSSMVQEKIPGQKITLSFSFDISKTKVFRTTNTVPYLFLKVSHEVETTFLPSTTGTLLEGQKINIITGEDLRIRRDNIPAREIYLLPYPNTITGTIVKKGLGNLTVEASVPSAGIGKTDIRQTPATDTTEKTLYHISLRETTEISGLQFPEPHRIDGELIAEPRQYTLSDLSVGTIVLVYAEEDVSTTKNLNALLIQPVSYEDRERLSSPTVKATTTPTHFHNESQVNDE